MIEFKLNQKKFDDLMNKIKSFNEDAMRAVHASMNRGMLYFIGTIVRTQMSGRKAPNFGLNRGSGRLANANRTISDRIGNDYRVRAQFGFPNAPYTVFQQKGGTFTSRGKMFTIPLTNEAKKTRPGDHANLTLAVINNQVFLGIRSISYPYKFTPMWILKRSITIPKRLHITEEFQRVGYDQVFRHAFVDVMRRAKV